MDEKSWKVDETIRGGPTIIEDTFKTLAID